MVVGKGMVIPKWFPQKEWKVLPSNIKNVLYVAGEDFL